MRVALTVPEQMVCLQIGGTRRLNALRTGQAARYGRPQDEALWDGDIESTGSEMAVAKALGVYWEPICRFTEAMERPGDVGPYQIRSTKYPTGRLILHPEDPDGTVFILVTGRIPTFELRGWIDSTDAKKPAFWDQAAPRPAYFVPQSALLPIERLRSRIESASVPGLEPGTVDLSAAQR